MLRVLAALGSSLVICADCAAADTQPVSVPSPAGAGMRTMSATTPSPHDTCPTAARCLITIHTKTESDDSCTANVDGYLKVTQGTPKIVWKIDPVSDAAGRSYEFHKKSGIVLIFDKAGQVEEGGAGDGTISSTAQRFHWKQHRRTLKTPEGDVFYFPIVLRTNSAGKVEMCASVDPRIVNE